MIRKLVADYADSQVAVVFDAKGGSFRNDIYPEYKANRPPMPDELRCQIAPIHDIIRKMGMPLLIEEGVEADDVIGTLAHQATVAKMNVLISTGDKDMAQLVTDHVTLINTMDDTVLDRGGVVEKFGVRPERIVDYLALVGDTSDNIPGVPKCGPRTAVKWLSEYDSLDGVMENADRVGGKVGENLRASMEQLPLACELATIKVDVELGYRVEQLEVEAPDQAGLLDAYKELEFKTWVAEILGDRSQMGETPAQQEIETRYETVLSGQVLAEWVDRLEAADCFAFDVETTSLDYMDAELVGVSFCCEAGSAAYVPVRHDYSGAPIQLSCEELVTSLRPLFEDERKVIVGQNLKYDITILEPFAVNWRARIFDTMLESYVLNSVASRHNMDDLALKYLGIHTTRFEDIAGKGSKQLTFNQIEVDKAARYAAEDADIALRLHQVLWPRLAKEASLTSVYEEIDLPLVKILSKVERNGVLIDESQLLRQSKELDKRMKELEQEAYGLAGEKFNLGSTKQLQEIFFEKLGLPVIKKTPKGRPSTAEPVLVELAHNYPLPAVVMEYRGLSKLKSTYTDQLPKQINAVTGRVHTSYHQAVAATGRLSSTGPNLQNIPIRTKEGRRVRKAFIAPPGYKIIAADYSQIELRIMAHLSGDEGLIRAFKENLDIHMATAAEVFGVDFHAVSDEHRRSAKAINFGLMYGMSAYGLSRQLNIAKGDAQQYIDLYFARYPGVKEYMDRTRALAAEQGYVETLFGRRLYLPEIRSGNFRRRQGAERAAINAPMQGTAADIIKRAMIAVDHWLDAAAIDTRMTMQVHDELVLEAPESRVDEVCAALSRHMEGAADLVIPLLVETGVGDDWDEAH